MRRISMGKATIRDVAQAAGVSIATVSRALNGGTVKSQTREQVRKAAERLGYQSGAVDDESRDDRTGTGNIAVFLTDLGNFYFTDVLKGLLSVAQASGYRVFVADIDSRATNYESTIASIVSKSEGQILVSPRLDDDMISAFPHETTVLANRIVDGYSHVLIDDAAGIQQAVRHMVSLGHRHIAYVSGLDSSWSNVVRRNAFDEACAKFDVESVVLGPFEPSYAGGQNAADAVSLEDGLTGVIAFNDLVACGLLSSLVERGVRVPEDMSIIGIDNSLLSLTSRPRLTSVDVRQERMGAVAMQVLLDQLSSIRDGAGFEPVSSTIAEILITRGSTGQVPRS